MGGERERELKKRGENKQTVRGVYLKKEEAERENQSSKRGERINNCQKHVFKGRGSMIPMRASTTAAALPYTHKPA